MLQRAAQLLRSRNAELAELETRNTGKPISETRAVDVLSGADCLEYYGGSRRGSPASTLISARRRSAIRAASHLV